MSKCIFCYSSANIFNSKKCRNGVVCKSCLKSIPNCFPLEYYEADELQKVQKYTTDKCFEEFQKTSELGSLLIDETHGLFAIGSTQNLFKLTDMGEFDLYPTNIRSSMNKIYVDIEFKCSIKPIDVRIKQIIKKNILCESTKADSNNIKWYYPNEISIFYEIISSAIKKQAKDILPLLSAYQFVTTQSKLIAESMLLVDDNYTLGEIKAQRNKLLSLYHPDNGGSPVYCERINTSYKYLVDHYKEKAIETGLDADIAL